MINQSQQKNVNQSSPILETNIHFSNLSATIQPIEISHSSMTNSTNTYNSESSSSSNQRGSSGLVRTDKNFEQQLLSLSSSQSDRLAEDRDYKVKCRSVQAQIKEMVFINSALQGRINEFREKIVTAKNERKFLLNKLVSYERGGGHENSNNKILHSVLSKKPSSKKSEQIKIKVEPET
ncbi:uncharacterized protein LOC141854399 [Brevipalpus obovatus]|uniref:uncharacterized protein LOC141854399 n=1 Tax=Brevipalpus obovatus TaxID=246614 RepID=UPI003D9E4590